MSKAGRWISSLSGRLGVMHMVTARSLRGSRRAHGEIIEAADQDVDAGGDVLGEGVLFF